MMSVTSLPAAILSGVVGLAGLFMAAWAEDAIFSGAGLVFFVFAVLFVFGMIRRHCDEVEAAGRES